MGRILPVISGLEDLDLDSSLSSSIRGGLVSLTGLVSFTGLVSLTGLVSFTGLVAFTGLVSLTGLGLDVFKTFLKASCSGEIERFFTSSTEFT